MNRFIESGLLYEFAGFAYYAFFLLMARKSSRAPFSRRSKILTLVAAIALVASVPLGYARSPGADIVMLLLAVAALISTWADRRSATPRG